MRHFLFFIFVLAALQAAPVGNPAAPQLLSEGFFIPYHSWVDGRAGYEGDFVQDGRMEQQDSGRVDRYAQSTNAGTLTLNFVDRLDIYGVLGASETRANWRFTTPADAIIRIQMETPYHLLWGIGARAALFEWGKVTLGMGGRYEQTRTDLSWLTMDGASQSVAGTQLKWHEWQVDLDLSYHIDLLTPYIGAKYASAKTHIRHAQTAIGANNAYTVQFDNRTPVGLILGCSLSTGKYFMLNLEARLIDEEAVTVSADIRF